MKTTRLALNMMAALAVCLFCNTLAKAELPITWVSEAGDDANPCTKTQPCRTFAGAIAFTTPGGKIVCADAGEFGPVSISKSFSIDCRRTRGNILGNILVSTQTNVKVRLQGLDIDGGGVSGIEGIKFAAGGSLYIEDTTINNMSTGINVALNQAANAEIFVINSHIRNNSSVGIFVSNANSGLVSTVIERTMVENNFFGLIGRGGARIDARNSTFARNAFTGVLAEVLTAGPTSIINVINCSIINNGTGLSAGNSAVFGQGTLVVSGTTISFNGTGVTAGNGNAHTYSDNILRNNTSNGAFNGPPITKN